MMTHTVDNNEDTSTALYNFISTECWTAALRALKRNPNEAGEWVIKLSKQEETGKVEECRVLPIHTACALQPSLHIVDALLEAYPQGAGFPDNQGLYPLHYACGNLASADVVEKILLAFPDALKMADPNGMFPLHHLTLWGISSPKVLDLILTYCDDEILNSKDLDGSTPLDLAFASEDNDNVEYIISELEGKNANADELSESIPPPKENITCQSFCDGELYEKGPPRNIKVNAFSACSSDDELSVKSPVRNIKKKSNASSVSVISGIQSNKPVDDIKVGNLQNQLSVMAQVCAQYKGEKDSIKSNLISMKKELSAVKDKFVIAEKENKMLDNYRSQNKSLEASLKCLRKEAHDLQKKVELVDKEQDMLECYKEQNKSLETSLKSLEKEFSEISIKSKIMEKDNEMMKTRINTFQELIRLISNTINTVTEKDKEMTGIDVHHQQPLTKEDTLCVTDESNFESMLDLDIHQDSDIIELEPCD